MENVSISADGYVIKAGKTFYYGTHKVKVLEVLPYAGTDYREVVVTKAGSVYSDSLYHDKDSAPIL